MIRVDVEDYCQQCLDFSPDVTRPERLVPCKGEEITFSDTIIQCKYRKRCSGMMRFLEQHVKKGTSR